MSNCLVNKKHFPLVLINLEGIVTGENVDFIIKEWTDLYKEQKEFFFIFNTTKFKNVNLRDIYRLTKFIKKFKNEPVQYLKRSIIIIDKSKTFQRNIIRFIFSIQSPTAPVYIANTAEESMLIHNNLLNDEPLPKHIISYK